MTVVWCFKAEDLNSSHGFSGPEMRKRIPQNFQDLKRGSWSQEEDYMLTTYIKNHGIWNWNEMAKPAGLLRSGKSCRLRWRNYLRPDIKRGNFSKDEVQTIIKLQKMLGNRWSSIAAKLPGRTDNEIKNFWNTHLKKRLSIYAKSSVQATERGGRQTSRVKYKGKYLSERKVSHPTEPIILNSSQDSKGSCTAHFSPIPNHVSDQMNKNFTIDENVGLPESTGGVQPIPMEEFCEVEHGETNTDEFLRFPYASGHFCDASNELWENFLVQEQPHESFENRCFGIAQKLPAKHTPKIGGKQKSSSENDSSLSAQEVLSSEEYSSKEFSMLSKLSADDLTSSSNSVNDHQIDKNQSIEDNVVLFESFGELSFWDQPCSMESTGKVEDYGETYTDEMWVQELMQDPNGSCNFDVFK